MILHFKDSGESMHSQLKNSLLSTEVIWIYDEPHRSAIVQQTFKNGRVLYCAMAYTGFEWICIDIQETDIHGAQVMYESLLKAVGGLSNDRN